MCLSLSCIHVITVFVTNATVIVMHVTVFTMHVTVRVFVMHNIVSRTSYIYDGTDSPEKQLDPTGPIAFRRRSIWPSVKYVGDFKKRCQEPPPP